MKEYASVDDPSLLGAIDSADSCRIVRQIGRGGELKGTGIKSESELTPVPFVSTHKIVLFGSPFFRTRHVSVWAIGHDGEFSQR
jgi:hypothetical protein